MCIFRLQTYKQIHIQRLCLPSSHRHHFLPLPLLLLAILWHANTATLYSSHSRYTPLSGTRARALSFYLSLSHIDVFLSFSLSLFLSFSISFFLYLSFYLTQVPISSRTTTTPPVCFTYSNIVKFTCLVGKY